MKKSPNGHHGVMKRVRKKEGFVTKANTVDFDAIVRFSLER